MRARRTSDRFFGAAGRFVLTLGVGSYAPGVAAGGANSPEEIALIVSVQAIETGTIRALKHDASEPRRPGETVRFEADADLPAGGRLVVTVEGWDEPTPLAPAEEGVSRYEAAAVLPSVSSGVYRVRARMLDRDGQEIASYEAQLPLTVLTNATRCQRLQASLDGLAVRFLYKKSVLPAEALSLVQGAAALLRSADVPGLTIELVTVTDEPGDEAFLIGLTRERARVVARYLRLFGAADGTTIRIAPHPRVLERDPDGDLSRSDQRRVDFRVHCPQA